MGERLAARWLRREGLKVLYRNYRAPGGGEVDLVCREGDSLVFVEVKTRTERAIGRPASAVDRDKQRLIAKGGLSWLRRLDHPEINFRFDVVEVYLAEGQVPRLERLVDAFGLPEPWRY